MKLVDKTKYFYPNLSSLMVGDYFFRSFDVDSIDLDVILFQTGYLTIGKVIESPLHGYHYILKFPNKEIKISFSNYIINNLIDRNRTIPQKIQTELYDSLTKIDLNTFKNIIFSIFTSIQCDRDGEMENNHGFYATVLYLYIQSLGIDITGEDTMSKKRIDITVKFPNVIYIMEIKETDEEPLARIKHKKYYNEYTNEGKDIYLVSISFDNTQKNLKDFIWEKVG
ncbi:MAG: PD-(D/E)XK nuclease domain-containing protein [Calditerrivibrio sp.]|nr:PD-(D/E)XK nuclease domain-containing protein [Calditerrivibrio sp.]MCA1932479.1 PD-(D/E)XK nuclease domain-containing protein [Calditerrivibrio sp.]